MQKLKKKLKIVSRNSKLALKQAHLVKDQIHAFYPDLEIIIQGIVTTGDKILDKSLDKIGGKGLFIKELQQHLITNQADIAVHSYKDVPNLCFSEFTIPAVLKRVDPSDCLVSNKYLSLDTMPDNSIIGTSSSRRIAILKHYYPNLQVKLLRGNIQTRLSRLNSGEFDGIILASAGLIRLNLEHYITQKLDYKIFIPAIGQGAIALEILSNRLDLMLLLAALDDNDTFLATCAEREVGRLIGADCSTPIGVYAFIDNQIMYLTVIVANIDTGEICTISMSDHKMNFLHLAKTVVTKLATSGAEKILDKSFKSYHAISSDILSVSDCNFELK